MIDTTTLLNELSLVNYVSSLDLDTKGQILRYYNNIIKARTASDPEHDKFKQDIIDNNYTYSIILNKLFYMAIFSSVTATQLESDIYGIENLSGMIRNLRAIMEQKGSKGSVYEELYNHVLKGEDISIIEGVQAADIPKALSCYGVQSVDDDKSFEDIEIADEEDESKFDDFFDNDGPDEEYSEDSVSDELDSVKKSVIESIKNYVEASEAENIDKITFNVNNSEISASSDLKINIDIKDNNVCIDINVNITESMFEGDDYEKSISCESYASNSTIEALKIKGADNEESVSKQIVEYIDKILNPVEVTDGADTFDDIPVVNEESAAEEDTDDKSSDEAEYADAFRQIYEGVDEDSTTPLKVAIDGILKSFYDLYMSCFSGITTPDGVLTNRGLLSIEKVDGVYKHVYNHSDIDLENTPITDKKYIAYQQYKSKYGQYYKAIMYAIGVTHCGSVALDKAMSKEELTKTVDLAVKDAEAVFGTQIDGRKSLLPKYADATQKSYYPKLHLQLMTGNYNTSKSMKEWVESTKGIHRNGVRVTNFDDIMKYARYLVSTCLTDALIDAGLKIEDAGNNDNEVMSICTLMSSQLKNIIVLTNTKKGYFTVKICSASTINSKALEKAITDYFNMSSSGSKATEIVVKNDGTESGVLEYDVILNRAEYDKPASFSADVIDDIIATGNVPSWSNAILGEKNNGGALVYDFKKNYSISIYGSSGSGKGIMTSALLSNAIAEGCEIMYIDGKPDNGAALAKVAWDKGVDCAVFNANSGAIVGGTCKTFPDTLENYSHGIRNMDMRNEIINKIPTLDDNEDWPFKRYETQSRTMLYEVSLALNGFKFVHDAIIRRSQGNVEKNPDGSDRWAVFVIDEIENAAGNENIIREKMKTYMDKVGEREVYKEEKKTDKNGNVTVQQKRDGKIKDERNWDKDTGYLFCKTWLDWADHVCANWDSVVTISLRNSSSTLITIFQTNKWFNQSGAITTGRTRIGQLMLRVAPKTIKIVGKGGLVTSNQWGDDDSYSWDSEVAKGKWVIASDEGKLKDSDTVFKPFRVFTTDLGADKAVPLDDIGAGASECYASKEDINDLEKKGKLHKPLGLQSYLTYIFNSLSDEIAEQINSGKRMLGTDTPEGVLSTSLTYFDNLIRGGNLANGKGLLERMYDVKPISRFSGTISQNELAVMRGREELSRESAQSELDALNEEIDTPKKYTPKGLLSIKDLQNNQNIDLKGYYDAFYNTIKRGMTNKTTADKPIKTVTLWVDNFMYLSEVTDAYDEIESMKQSLINIAGNPNKSDKERAGANLVYVVLKALSDGVRTYDEVLTTEQLRQLTTESNAEETYKANRQTTKLTESMKQSIRNEVLQAAQEMKDAGEFEGMTPTEIKEIIMEVIQDIITEKLSGGN